MRMLTKLVLFIAFLIISLIIMVYVWDEYLTSNNKIYKYIESPDNKYIAYIFSRDFGATTRESYNLSILKKGKRFGNSSGNVYISYGKFEVEWVKPNELKVTMQDGTVFKKVTHFEDIQIIYSD